MSYSLQIGARYLRSKKRATVSMITLISIIGVALGVAALLAVLSITTGFEESFRDKVLGVNAHVLILKYGREFRDYPEVLESVGKMPEVAGLAPFSINEMMLTKGDHRAVVLVKGVTPEGVNTVLDLPQQMIAGDLEGLRRAGATPNRDPRVVPEDDWDWLRNMKEQQEGPQKGDSPLFRGVNSGEGVEKGGSPRVRRQETVWEEDRAREEARKPKVGKVAKPSEIEAILEELDENDLALPEDPSWEAGLSMGGGQEPLEALPGVIVGKTLAADMGLEVGDRVRMISPLAALGMTLSGTGAATTRSREFKVIGVFQAGFQEYDSGLV